MEQKKVKEFEKFVPELEGHLSATREQLESTKHSLEEKTAALVQTRKHLKNARERGMVSVLSLSLATVKPLVEDTPKEDKAPNKDSPFCTQNNLRKRTSLSIKDKRQGWSQVCRGSTVPGYSLSLLVCYNPGE